MKFKRKLCIVLTALMVWLAAAAPSLAYFNRGAVEISLSSSSVSVAAGSSVSVSVNIDPIKEDQLPGCGMAECPQTCGSSGCMNENGECTCSGTEYKTYYSSVSVVSSNQSVAAASYSNGTVTVKGISSGTAVITVTGSMRQYTDKSVTLNVTVNGSSPAAAGTGGAISKTDKKTDKTKESPAESDGIKVEEVSRVGASANGVAANENSVEISGNNSSDGTNEYSNEQDTGDDSSADEQGELRNTKKGLYRIVELTDKTDIQSCFEQAALEESHIVFQKKSGENVKWSWTFDASEIDLNAVSGLDLNIDVSAEPSENIRSSLNGGDAYYMKFKNTGKLPAEAEIYMNVSEIFPDSTVLKLYHVDSFSGTLEKTDDNVMAENGYATFTISNCSDYILTDVNLKSDSLKGSGTDGVSGFGAEAAAAFAVIFAAAVAAGIVVYRKRNKRR